MTKAGFFTFMFFAFQTITYAQPEFSVKAGVSQLWDRPFTSYSNDDITGNIVGFDVNIPFRKSDFSIGTGYYQHAYDKTHDIEITIADTVRSTTHMYYNTSTKSQSFPLLVCYNYKKFIVNAGLVYKHTKSEGYSYFEEYYFMRLFNKIGVTTGIEYSFNKYFSIQGSLYAEKLFPKVFNSSPFPITNPTNLDLTLKYYINRTNFK